MTVSILAMRLSLYPVLLAATMSALIWDFFLYSTLGATDALQENDEKLSMRDKKELTSEISNAALRLNKQLENLLNTV